MESGDQAVALFERVEKTFGNHSQQCPRIHKKKYQFTNPNTPKNKSALNYEYESKIVGIQFKFKLSNLRFEPCPFLGLAW